MTQSFSRYAHLRIRAGNGWVWHTYRTDDPIWPETLRAALQARGNVRVVYGTQPEPQPSAPRP